MVNEVLLKEETLIGICEELNTSKAAENVLKIKLTERVERIVYLTPLKEVISNGLMRYIQNPIRFFAVKNENSKYVCIIYDGPELHWFTTKEERRKGYLTNALIEVIFPYIKTTQSKEKIVVRISDFVLSRDNFIASWKVSEKCGFVYHKENDEYVLNLDKFEDYNRNVKLNDILILQEAKKRILASAWNLEALKVFLEETNLFGQLHKEVKNSFISCYSCYDEIEFQLKKSAKLNPPASEDL